MPHAKYVLPNILCCSSPSICHRKLSTISETNTPRYKYEGKVEYSYGNKHTQYSMEEQQNASSLLLSNLA